MTISSPSTFPARFAAAAARFPDRDAIVMPGRTVSYEDLLRLAAAVQAGCPKVTGQRVLIACSDKVGFMATVLAVQGLGGVAVPLDTLQPEAAAALAGDCEPALLLHDVGQDGEALVELARGAFPAVSAMDLGPLLSALATTEFHNQVGLDDPCLMLYTSGTTGPRKGVVLTHSAFAAPSYSINRAMGYGGSEREYVCGDLTHAFALGRLRCLLPLGAAAVIDNGKFMPQLALQGLAEGDCNAISGPASTVTMLLQLFEEEFTRFSESLRTIKMGSQSIPLEIKHKLMAAFPAARIYQNYGLSEAQRLTLLEFHSEQANLESTGRPVEGNAIRIADETGAPLAAGEVGHIAVSSPNLMTGYWRRDALNAERMREGFLITDDMGYLTPDGYLIFAGRADEVINTGGLKFTLEDIEDAIRPVISDAPFAVCVIPDPEGILTDVPALVVEAKTGEIVPWSEWKRRRILLLRSVRHLPVPKYAYCVDKLPRTETGKVKRKVLTRWLTDKFFVD